MTDIKSSAARSYNMSRIRGKDTRPELIVRKFLFHNGFRYRLHNHKLPGTPDIVLPKYKTVIFINGCFWHGHNNCKYYKLPKSNNLFWEQKISGTKARDLVNKNQLESDGYKVITIWECELKNHTIRENTLISLLNILIPNKNETVN